LVEAKENATEAGTTAAPFFTPNEIFGGGGCGMEASSSFGVAFSGVGGAREGAGSATGGAGGGPGGSGGSHGLADGAMVGGTHSFGSTFAGSPAALRFGCVLKTARGGLAAREGECVREKESVRESECERVRAREKRKVSAVPAP